MAATQREMGVMDDKDKKTKSTAAMLFSGIPLTKPSGEVCSPHCLDLTSVLISDFENKQINTFYFRIFYSQLQCLQGLKASTPLIPSTNL